MFNNLRRVQLIRLRAKGGLSSDEARELQQLQDALATRLAPQDDRMLRSVEVLEHKIQGDERDV
jgi:hypothetical protein